MNMWERATAKYGQVTQVTRASTRSVDLDGPSKAFWTRRLGIAFGCCLPAVQKAVVFTVFSCGFLLLVFGPNCFPTLQRLVFGIQ